MGDEAGKAPAAPGAVHAPEPQAGPKRITYLTNLKTFLTFIVVAHHAAGQWYNSSAGGIGTYGGYESPSFTVVAAFFQNCNQMYFMSTFFLVSGYFCPRSLDRKGFRKFVLDKIVRLGGPFVIYSVLLGPAMDLWISSYGGVSVLSWQYNMGPPWFVLWLLNFSLIYAAVAHIAPKGRQCASPRPLLVVGGALALAAVLCPCFWGLSLVLGEWQFLGGMVYWSYGICVYVPAFFGGVGVGRHGLLNCVEEMKTWFVWVLRATCLLFWILILLAVVNANIWYLPFVSDIIGAVTPLYATVMNLAILQLFHQYFNGPQSKLGRGAGQAAYMVYVIHLPVVMTAVIAFCEIMMAAGLSLIFVPSGFPVVAFFASDANCDPPGSELLAGVQGGCEPALLPDGWLWAGFFFTLVVTNAVVWPLGFYARRLPVLNQMF